MQELEFGHKQCYQFLKSLLIGSADYPGKCINLSSYMLKTAMLYHVHLDPKCREMKYSVWVPQILCYLRDGFESVRMPCFLSRNQHVWGNCIAAPMLNRSFLLNTDLQKVFGHYELNYETVYAMLWVEFWRRAIMVRHGPFDIRGGGGAWNFFEKNSLALILAEKNNLAQWHCEKNNLSPIA